MSAEALVAPVAAHPAPLDVMKANPQPELTPPEAELSVTPAPPATDELLNPPAQAVEPSLAVDSLISDMTVALLSLAANPSLTDRLAAIRTVAQCIERTGAWTGQVAAQLSHMNICHSVAAPVDTTGLSPAERSLASEDRLIGNFSRVQELVTQNSRSLATTADALLGQIHHAEEQEVRQHDILFDTLVQDLLQRFNEHREMVERFTQCVVCLEQPMDFHPFDEGGEARSRELLRRLFDGRYELFLQIQDPAAFRRPGLVAEFTKALDDLFPNEDDRTYLHLLLDPESWPASDTPIITLNCLHSLHVACLEEMLTASMNPGSRVDAGCLRCPSCRRGLGVDLLRDPASLAALASSCLRNHIRPSMQILIKYLQHTGEPLPERFIAADQQNTTAEDTWPELANEEVLTEVADYLSRYIFSLCTRCKHPFFQGVRDCQIAGPAGEDEAGQLCAFCDLDKPQCEHEQSNWIWKCFFCCNEALFLCSGKYYCNPCHSVSPRPVKPCTCGRVHPANGANATVGCVVCLAEKGS
ncbi:hypothetical protein H696_02984 [Fonticula alba]|uniref:RING-type domain-containing protein n=1 Tax=Fonticula alba TaxID=691883 RepID=A0A058ZB26_FONAL|nr:hypothetical protein H696_02984 [Fonticula alba]KCV70627.1 hypothetical protein H696_02984 [Fonticula alba]|eukprot:XP_009495143.1 hypothetical protein H696_02984 [Fonticula alba]